MRVPSCLKCALVLSLPLLGCGGGGPCAQRSGTYRATFSTRSGNCGDIGESIVDSNAKSPCGGTSTASANNCEVTTNATCALDNLGNTLSLVGDVTWSHDGNSGSAVADVTIRNANGVATCHGTYDVTYTRL